MKAEKQPGTPFDPPTPFNPTNPFDAKVEDNGESTAKSGFNTVETP